MPWETLRPFFRSKGYILFKAGGPDGELSEPQPTGNGYTFPAVESFGLHGDRIGFKSTFGRVSNCFGNNSHRYLKHFLQKSTVFEARDRSCIFPVLNYILRFSHDRDVVIKLVRKGDQGRSEYEILCLHPFVIIRGIPLSQS